jgi:L-rhamnonate dehydratase
MRITKVEATCHKIPITLPLGKTRQEPVLVARVETDEGITGFGMTEGRMRFSTREFVNRILAPFLLGKNPLETERIWNVDAYHELGMAGPLAELGLAPGRLATDGLVRWGFSAVDIALWDIMGKYFGQPVYRLLGGSRNPIPAYVTFGLPIYSREELVEVARQLVRVGQDKLKMNVGYAMGSNGEPDLAEDEARVRAVREVIGDGGLLMVDANDRFNFTQARELARRIEPYKITWFESPTFSSADYRPMAELRKCTTIPITHGGALPGRRWLYREFIINGAVDFVQPNVIQVGGYTEALKIAHMAQGFSMQVANGGAQPHFNMQLIAGVANGWIVECHYGHMLRDEILFVDPPSFDRGWLTVPETPGLGLQVNEAALREYQEA